MGVSKRGQFFLAGAGRDREELFKAAVRGIDAYCERDYCNNFLAI